ncbi:hypothetical protein BH24ACI5_BH24ACI5_14540 [soil metagenome]
MILALIALLLTVQSQTLCPDVASCRSLALEAHERENYEAFHDLAWAAYRKGRPNDPEMMLLVARAQSLSGRPGDALVMLERIVAAGAVIDSVTSEDFARVRALPRWPEVAAKFGAASAEDPAPAAKHPAPAAKSPAPPAKDPASPAKDPAPPAKAPAPSAKDPAPSAKDPAPPAKDSAPSASAPLRFTTILTPSALVYDAISRRFIVADRRARRIAVIDATTGGVATLVGPQGDLGEIGGITIDSQQGDLWVVSSGEGGVQHLHRIQLISGRVLRRVPLSGMSGQAVALAFVPDAGLVVSDDTGRLMRIQPGGRSEPLADLEYVPRALAADLRGRLYVTAGGPRLARFTIGTSLRKMDVVELPPGIPADAPFAVAEGRLHFVVPVDGSYEIRSSSIR